MYKLLDKVTTHFGKSFPGRSPIIVVVVFKGYNYYEVAWSGSSVATVQVMAQDIISCVGSMSIEEGLIDSREVIRRAALALSEVLCV